MQWSQFKSQVEAQGVKLPKGWGGSGGRADSYTDFAGLDHPGLGHKRNYTDQDVQLAVNWARVHEVVGHPLKDSAKLAQKAAQLLTEYNTGWIVMSQWRVFWVEQPTVHLFDKGAVCLEVRPIEQVFD